MKKFRHYLAVMLCISMLFCIMPAVNAATDTDYICSTVRFTDGSGNALTSITAGTLKADMTVKSNTDASDSLVFALLLYSDNKLIASDSMTRSVSGGAELSAQVTVPDNTADCKAVAVLWNSVNDMRAICAAAVFPGGVNLLRGLTADGNTITGFDSAVKEYTVTVENDASAKPVINAETANNASTVKYIGDKAFPGKTIVELASADGSNTTAYTVNYKTKTGLAANARIVSPTGGNYGTFDVGKNLNTGDGGDVKDSSRTVENGRLGSRMHWDRNQPGNYNTGYTNEVRGISEDYKFLLGSDYLMSTAQSDKRANNGYQTSFTLYRSATLYVLSSEATTAEGWDLQKNTQTPFMTVQNDTERKLTNLSTKHFDVTDTSAGLDITIPAETMYGVNSGGKKSAGVSITAIVYDGYTTIGDNEQDITPAPTTTPTPTAAPEPTNTPKPTEAPSPSSTPEPTATIKPSNAGDLKYTKNGEDYNVKDSSTGKAPVVSSGFKVKSGDEYGSKLFPNRTQPANSGAYTNEVVSISSDYDFLLGSDYVMSCLAGWDERANGGFETEFKLYKDATVYLFATAADEAKAAENGWTVRKVTDNSNAFMTIQRDQTDYMKYVLSKRFSSVDSSAGTRVALTKEMLITSGMGCINFTVIDYKNNTIPSDSPSPTTPPPAPSDKPKSGADSVKIAKTNDDGTEEILAGAPTEVSKNLTPYTDENPTDGSIIMFDRGRHASYPDYNNIKEIAADYSFIIGCDYIGQPAQGNSPSHRASAGYETSFKLYEGATVYVFTSTGNSDKAAENSWTYLESGNDLPFMKLRTKPNDATDAVVGLTSVMSKHFDGAESGETVVIPKELLYRTGGDENSSGFTLFVIKYDK